VTEELAGPVVTDEAHHQGHARDPGQQLGQVSAAHAVDAMVPLYVPSLMMVYSRAR
jgi:hypothetical protein